MAILGAGCIQKVVTRAMTVKMDRGRRAGDLVILITPVEVKFRVKASSDTLAKA